MYIHICLYSKPLNLFKKWLPILGRKKQDGKGKAKGKILWMYFVIQFGFESCNVLQSLKTKLTKKKLIGNK